MANRWPRSSQSRLPVPNCSAAWRGRSTSRVSSSAPAWSGMLNLDTHVLVHALQGKSIQRERELLSQNDWSISAIVLWGDHKAGPAGAAGNGSRRPGHRPEPVEGPCLADHSAGLPYHAKPGFKSDPVDELIAATSIAHDVPLLTRDRTIRASKLVPVAH